MRNAGMSEGLTQSPHKNDFEEFNDSKKNRVPFLGQRLLAETTG
jgi:hypothetical protein